MRNRVILLAAAGLAGVVAAVTSPGAAQAADECLAKPKGVAPAGQHWYYSTDRKLGRKCWYLDEAGGKTVAATPKKQQAAAPPPEQSREADALPENQDARAEFVDEPSVQPSPTVAVAPTVVPQVQPPQDTMQDTAASEPKRDWTVASRWPEPSDTFASNPAPAPQREQPAAPVAATPAPQPVASVDSGSDLDFGLIAAGLILLVVVGGTIMIVGRRKSIAPDNPYRAAKRGQVRWSDRDASGYAPEHLAVARSSRSDVVDEVERLLAARRQERQSHALS